MLRTTRMRQTNIDRARPIAGNLPTAPGPSENAASVAQHPCSVRSSGQRLNAGDLLEPEATAGDQAHDQDADDHRGRGGAVELANGRVAVVAPADDRQDDQ